MSRGKQERAIARVFGEAYSTALGGNTLHYYDPNLFDELWTATTDLVLPLTPGDFSVGSVLPAVMYMIRRGHRRGKGRFHETYGASNGLTNQVTVASVARKLVQWHALFSGFSDEIRLEILGDLLLATALETKNRKGRHDIEVLRVYPSHYFASWIDLPQKVGNLRLVPELIANLLSVQGKEVNPASKELSTSGGVSQSSLLIKVFAKGTVFSNNPSELHGDKFDEQEALAVDELLMVRLGAGCSSAPEKSKDTTIGASIPRNKPLSSRASEIFRSDLVNFLEACGEAVPRRILTGMLEALIGMGLWHTSLTSLRCSVEWEKTGTVPHENDQIPVMVFVDASNGAIADLRNESERSFSDILSLLDDAIAAMACIRVLQENVKYDQTFQLLFGESDGNAERLNKLYRIRKQDVPGAEMAIGIISRYVAALGEKLNKEDLCPPAQQVLLKNTGSDPVRALGEALVELRGGGDLRSRFLKLLDSAGMSLEPHGLVRKRSVKRKMSDGSRRQTEARSIALSDELLEALVHTHLFEREFPVSYQEFLTLLRDRYGLCVDQAPPGHGIPQELLVRNRNILERRLRDLGLLRGVNDSESMKLLRSRYKYATTGKQRV